jgi:hypothetical protein
LVVPGDLGAGLVEACPAHRVLSALSGVFVPVKSPNGKDINQYNSAKGLKE